jgi:L-threonylcarbamoyladenylate synthase
MYVTFHSSTRQRLVNHFTLAREEARLRAEILKIHSENPESSLIKYAAEQIQSGHVLGMPTDTFYGLAADPFNLRAVERVYEIKSRLRHKPLSLLIEHVDQAEEFARPLTNDFYLLARRFWPGPLTMIVPAASHLPLKVTANTGNVALRVPAAEIPLAVVRSAKIPITATSANLSGAEECTTAEQVQTQLQDRISLIVDGGKSPRATSSTIVHFKEDGTWVILRDGAIAAKEIVEALS